MNTKDFALLAQIIHNAKAADGMPEEWANGCDAAREFIASKIAELAPDRLKFLDACGWQS